MAKARMSLERYVARSMNSVRGFLNSLDAQVVSTLLSHQRGTNVSGHLCEIGVHHGRLFLMLALARQHGERALAIDLFEDDAMNVNTEHAGRSGALLVNARRLGIELSHEEILKTSSLNLKSADIVARTTGPIRFFSIDGGHLYRHVAHDLRLAQETLSAAGIIAIDDFFNIDWADVSFATYDFLRHADSVVPFAVTPTKLYLAPSEAAEMYKGCLRGRVGIGRVSSVEILSHDVLALRQGRIRRGIELLRDTVRRRVSWPW